MAEKLTEKQKRALFVESWGEMLIPHGFIAKDTRFFRHDEARQMVLSVHFQLYHIGLGEIRFDVRPYSGRIQLWELAYGGWPLGLVRKVLRPEELWSFHGTLDFQKDMAALLALFREVILDRFVAVSDYEDAYAMMVWMAETFQRNPSRDERLGNDDRLLWLCVQRGDMEGARRYSAAICAYEQYQYDYFVGYAQRNKLEGYLCRSEEECQWRVAHHTETLGAAKQLLALIEANDRDTLAAMLRERVEFSRASCAQFFAKE